MSYFHHIVPRSFPFKPNFRCLVTLKIVLISNRLVDEIMTQQHDRLWLWSWDLIIILSWRSLRCDNEWLWMPPNVVHQMVPCKRGSSHEQCALWWRSGQPTSITKMIRWGHIKAGRRWNGWLGRKNENGVRGKNLKNGEKREENYMKKREMGLKNASFEEKAWKCIFWGHKLQKFSRGWLPTPPAPLHNPPTNLFVKNYIKNGGKGLLFWS